MVLFDHTSGRSRAIVVDGRAIFRVAETFRIIETNTPALANAILASARDSIRINRVGIDCTGFTIDLNGIVAYATKIPNLLEQAPEAEAETFSLQGPVDPAVAMKDEKILHEEKDASSSSPVTTTVPSAAARTPPQRVLLPRNDVTTSISNASIKAKVENPRFAHDGRRNVIRSNNALSRLMMAKKLLADRGKGV